MYDANPRTHLARVSAVLAAGAAVDYRTLRYAALDARLAIETTLAELLTSCYSGASTKFADLWRPKGRKGQPSFTDTIRTEEPDFDLINKLVPAVLRFKNKIQDYQPVDLDRLAEMHHKMGEHLHHWSRYKDGRERANDLAAALQEINSYLSQLLLHPRYWVEFHGKDQKLFEAVVAGTKTLESFVGHIEAGKLKEYSLKDVHHLQESIS
jgi:hypothetical protein